MLDRKDRIKAINTVPEVLSKYGIEIKRNRCRGFCHNGKDYNMKVSQYSCYCFVCNQSYDIFDIVMHFECCDFASALNILSGENLTYTKTRQAVNRLRQRESDRKARERQEAIYWELFGEWIRLDKIRCLSAPKAPTEEPTEDFISALSKLPYIEYLMDCEVR